MSAGLLAIVVGIPLALHVGATALAYHDAGEVGLDPPEKWAAIVFLVPILGGFLYLMERSELSYDPETDPYRRETYNFHPTRADEARGLHPGSGDESSTVEQAHSSGDDGGAGDGDTDSASPPRSNDDSVPE